MTSMSSIIMRQRHYGRLLTYFLWLVILIASSSGADDSSDFSIVARMPTYVTHERDSYLCMRVELPEDETFSLIGFEPLADQSQVHHMLLFGCREKPSNTKDDVWPCRMAPACEGMDGVLYGWGRNAPSVSMPKGSGFTVGKKSTTQVMVLQIHFLELRRQDDVSGLKILLSRLPVEKAAGMFAFAASFSIPPKKQSHLVENSCCFTDIFSSQTFASRVHTHALGRRVTLDISSPGIGKRSTTRIVDLDPLQPQGFYATNTSFELRHGDVLKTTCEFNSESQSHVVRAGHSANDEMCNLYLMSTRAVSGFSMCVDGTLFIKEGSGVGGHVTPVAENQSWRPTTDFGQISGIFYSQSHKHAVWLFSRKDVIFDANTFDGDNRMRNKDGYIKDDTITLLDLQTGKTKKSFGGGEFLLPHMVSEAPDGHLWVTDVGSHQVFKVVDGKVTMSLGQHNSPGSSEDQFCKPTEAIETRDGRLFISDGYCNDRILEYNASTGKFVKSYDIPMKNSLPHSLVYDECKSVLLVALRVKRAIVKLDLKVGKFEPSFWSLASFGQPFAVRLGMYGVPYVLTWDLDKKSYLVELSQSEETVSRAWELPGVRAPHDFAFVPSLTFKDDPVERNISIIVTETTMSADSRAIKYLFQAASSKAIEKSAVSQPKNDGLEETFSHMNTAALVKIDGGDTTQGGEMHRKNNDLVELQETATVSLTHHVFIFAVSLTMIVLWGFLQTLGTSQRLARSRL